MRPSSAVFRARSLQVSAHYAHKCSTRIALDYLKEVLEESIGQVAHVAIETDIVNQYPRGAARVVFVHAESFVKAVAMRELVLTIETGLRKVR